MNSFDRLQGLGLPVGGAADCRGFSLIEIVVAFSILALALGVLLRIFAGGVRAAGTSESYSNAVLRAESLLAPIGTEISLRPGQEQGEFKDGYRWRRFIRPYQWTLDPATQRLAAYQVDVEVSWQAGSKRQAVTLTTLRLAPSREGSAADAQ